MPTLMRLFALGLLMLVVLGCSGCLPPPEPPARLTFVRFSARTDGGYDMVFTSNVDFSSPIWTEGRRAAMTPMFLCSLDDDLNFSMKHVMKRTLEGYVRDEGQKVEGQAGLLEYTVRVDFAETSDEGSSQDYLDAPKIRQLLEHRQVISCKVRRTFYFSSTKPYYSNVMQVPVKSLLDQVAD